MLRVMKYSGKLDESANKANHDNPLASHEKREGIKRRAK
jgi:hypothetical protein